MKTAQYVADEKAISAGASGDIRRRWLNGLRLLRDPEKMSPGGASLRHGVSAQLVAAATARGYKLTEQELRARIRCARKYPTEAQINSATNDFASWWDLVQANFPAYPAPPDEPPADHRTESEKDRDRARVMLEMVGEQGTLFPLDTFEPVDSTLKELFGYRDQQREITARFAERDRKRDEYLDAMFKAVDGDLSQTWATAHKAAFPGQDIK